MRAVVVTPPFFANNRLFNLADPIANRDNVLYPWHLLREKLRAKGCELCTADLFPREKADKILHIEMPVAPVPPEERPRSYIWLTESEVIIPRNWKVGRHEEFVKLFTWHDGFVDNERYIKLNFPQQFWPEVPTDARAKTGFCTLIAGNKRVSHPLELYSHRVNAIRWFENHAPEGFEFYGMGWHQYTFSGPLRPLNRMPWLRKKLAPNHPSYRGAVESKFATLPKYKFAICYENARDIPGYITEKIFDCLQSGCIPVYWGAPNITEYVPAECFVDLRDFMQAPNTPNYAELNRFLRTMPEKTYTTMLHHVAEYIRTQAIHGPWSAETFAETLATHLL